MNDNDTDYAVRRAMLIYYRPALSMAADSGGGRPCLYPPYSWNTQDNEGNSAPPT